ncbi:DUF2441 domain-containing protein [Paraburkholderia tropica]|uniref:DUF2441 domain-containing protein n=1 Tax=Paraburkholderia tropica TaxID=92647 RepID=UPI003D2A387B
MLVEEYVKSFEVKDGIFYHLSVKADHAKDFASFEMGGTYLIGSRDSPIGRRWRNSSVRTYDAKIMKYSYQVMLREAVFESMRLKNFPSLPSRYSCLFLSDTLEGAHKWAARIPQEGERQILKLQLLDGQLHRTNESHLPIEHLNIAELELWAGKYWNGLAGNRLTELLFCGHLTVKEIISMPPRVSSVGK